MNVSMLMNGQKSFQVPVYLQHGSCFHLYVCGFVCEQGYKNRAELMGTSLGVKVEEGSEKKQLSFDAYLIKVAGPGFSFIA